MRPLILAALLTPLALPAAAESGRDACAADAARLCPKAARGPERRACLEARPAELSAECRERLAQERAEGEAFQADCKTDIAAACLNLQGRALVECLEARGDKLEKPCADRLAAMKAARRATHEKIPAGCKDDAPRLCAASAAGGVADCLRANKAKLSKACAAALP